MNELRFSSHKFNVVVESSALKDMIRAADEFHPRMVATSLYGYYSEDGTTAVVTGIAPLPRDSVIGHDECVRGTEGLDEFFQKLWDRPERRYFLGDFHARPNGDTKPSKIDDESMHCEAQDTCAEVLLLVVGGSPGARLVSATIYSRSGERSELGEQYAK